jgi:putative ABC transport system permease protein
LRRRWRARRDGLVRSFLFNVTATDPTTFAGVGVFFAVVALVACLVPAWRAWRVDPVAALRTE